MLDSLDASYYTPRSYIVAASDRMGAQHALASEKRRASYKVSTVLGKPKSTEAGADPCMRRTVEM